MEAHGPSDPVRAPDEQSYAVRGAPRKSLEQSGAVKKHLSTVSWMGSTVGGTINMAVPQLAGAIDIVAVLQPDGSIKCSPFYVRFGKYQVHLHQRNKDVAIVVNGRTADFGMNLSRSGEAYFVAKDAEGDTGGATGSSPPGSPMASSSIAEEPRGGAGGGGGGGDSLSDSAPAKPRGMLRVSSEQEMLGAITEWYSATSLVSMAGCSPFSSQQDLAALDDAPSSPQQQPPAFVPGLRPRSKRPGKLGLVGIGFGAGAAGLKQQQQQPGAGTQAPRSSSSLSSSRGGSRRSSLETGPRASPVPLPIRGSDLGAMEAALEEQEQEEAGVEGGPCGEDVDKEDEELYLDAAGAVEEEQQEQKEGGESAELKIEVSLCGREVAERQLSDPRDLTASFSRHRVAMQDCVGPDGVVGDEEALMVRVNGHIYPWREVAAYPDSLSNGAGGADAVPELSGRSPPGPWQALWPFNRRASIDRKQQKQQQLSSVSLGTAEVKAVQDVAMGNKTVSLAERALNNPRTDEGLLQTCDGRSLVPTSEQLQSLGLRLGQNTVEFVLNQHIFGDYRLRAFMYLMPWNSRLVVSDVDGTITRSDVLGHLMPAVGMDWSHSGVVSLLSDIYTNGYMVMYLSSRAISQAGLTRDFLQTLRQGEKRLPHGPIVISPDGLFPSLYREVVVKRPHEFKIATLSAIRSLFPDDWNPFYAGFGNRGTDEVSYKAVGISPNRIFTINPKGEIKRFAVADRGMEGSFSSLGGINTLVDEVFPPMMNTDPLGDAPARHEFSDVSYWKPSFGMELIDSDEEDQMTVPKPPAPAPKPTPEPTPPPQPERVESPEPPFAYMSMYGSEGGM